jgi:hypothetical protein
MFDLRVPKIFKMVVIVCVKFLRSHFSVPL